MIIISISIPRFLLPDCHNSFGNLRNSFLNGLHNVSDIILRPGTSGIVSDIHCGGGGFVSSIDIVVFSSSDVTLMKFVDG